jgi:hypothetical protein
LIEEESTMQNLVVALLVIGCSLYAAWALMPAAARRAIASSLLNWRLPVALVTRLQAVVKKSSGCGCDGCDHAPAKAMSTAKAEPQVVTFHPRTKLKR